MSPSPSTSTSTNSSSLDHNLSISPSSSSSSINSLAEAERSILKSALDTIEQPLQMLRDGIVTDKHLRAISTLVPGSTVGKHLRHVHDHYRLLLSSLSNSTSSQPPTIDYDQRPPAPNLENSSKACLEEFESLMKNLKNLVKGDGSWYGRECLVRATTPEVIDFRSSVGRELWFVSLHSIHHYALARAILTRELGLGDVLGSRFGVAPSTIVNKALKERSKL